MRPRPYPLARLNCISHFLNQIPYEDLPREKVGLGKGNVNDKYDDNTFIEEFSYIPKRF